MGHGTRVVVKGGEFNSKTKVAVDNPNQPRGVKVEVVEAQAEHEEQGGGGTTIRMKGLGPSSNRKLRPGETRVAILDGPNGTPLAEYTAEEVHSQEQLREIAGHVTTGKKPGATRAADTSHRDTVEAGDRTLVDAAMASVKDADAKRVEAEKAKEQADAENADLRRQLDALKAKPVAPAPKVTASKPTASPAPPASPEKVEKESAT